MAKRFTDTEKWKEPWFRNLSPTHKSFWEYIRDNCNHAGIWNVDFDLAQFYIGAELKAYDITEIFKKDIIILSRSKWFLIDFIPFQYNCPIEELNPSSRVHLSVIKILKKYGLDKGFSKPLANSLLSVKDKAKDKAKAGVRVGEKPKTPKNKVYSATILQIVRDFYELKDKSHKLAKHKWRGDKKLINGSCDVIDKLNRIDDIPFNVIKTVIMRSINDEFWMDQIISLRGLREIGKNKEIKFMNASVALLGSGYKPITTRKLIGYLYECPSCGDRVGKREFRPENQFDAYTCEVEGCPKAQMVNGQMVGSTLKFIEKIYKEES